ncbi:hypothetical protein CRM22_005179 [Opisthorchis felineus]|uniref:Thiolase N-terminal domain-containing protein n=1 Tax=Opisthorchis felineus TaxID=147828 RepID=A0A4S2LTK5_OPIFE|nr:hypothetical protein CRM22_005179 [Opisthorchis felineus]
MALIKKAIFIVSAKRTPFGAFGGALKSLTATDLAEAAARFCIAESGLSPSCIGSIVFGNVIQSNRDTFYLARHTGIRVGVPIETPALMVNRACGSGFQAVVTAVHDLVDGTTDVALAGGSENMSEVPFAVQNVRFGTALGGRYELSDTLWNALTDFQCDSPMGITAENLAEKYKITREDCDQLAVRSQTRWKTAHEAGDFQQELCSVTGKDKKNRPIEVRADEHPRTTTMEQLGKLKPAFKKGGVITAGNASGICDGASALLLATEEAVKQHNLKPLARVSAYSVAGCEPTIMGIGPVAAMNRMMSLFGSDKTGRDTSNYFDLVELNEAFSAQYLACERELQLNPEATNLCGGAIALGHPLGATGARILTHLTHQLAKAGGKYKRAVGTACIGGGQGIAVALEAV